MTRTALYRFYNADGALLYVGITENTVQRWRGHASEKPWWPEVVRKTVDWFDDRATAEVNERVAIRSEDPRYNVRHKGGDATAVVMHFTPWWDYVQRVADGRSTHKIAAKIGVGGNCVARWKYSRPTGENVVAFARGFGADTLAALVAADFVTAEEARTAKLALMSTEDLLAEIQAQIEGRTKRR
jgi:hypothetical protein